MVRDRYYKRPASSLYSTSHEHTFDFSEKTADPATGEPCRKTKLSRRDAGVLLLQLISLTAALLTVFYQPLAIWLGQLDQLIILGFFLGVMTLFLQEQVLQTVLIFMGYQHNTTLQDLDSVLRKDLLAPQIPLYYRLILLTLVGLPLALSASYKLFVGGSSTKEVTFPSGTFGYSATPGNQRIGDGLTLLSDIYRPFWIDPAIPKAYGFNLYIASNDTAVIPDTPYPSYLSSIQASLSLGELIQLHATVNATVSTLANPTSAQRNSTDYWRSISDQFGHDVTISATSGASGAKNALLAGMGSNLRSNFSIAFYSAWNETRNETFFSEAIRVENYRALYQVSWNVSSSSTNLTGCMPVNSAITDLSTAMDPASRNANQTLIQNQYLGIQEIFTPFLGEYDWHNRDFNGAFDYPYPTAPSEPERWEAGGKERVNTLPALSAAMIWARTTSYNGGDRPNRDPDRVVLTMYDKPANEVQMVKTIPTLRRSWMLVIVLCVNPVIAVLCLLLKLVMWRSPVGPEFNIVSLLAASRGKDLSALKGAGLSGKLGRVVGVRFFVDRAQSEEGKAYLGLELDGVGRNEKLEKGFMYG